jgi:signal peptidase I
MNPHEDPDRESLSALRCELAKEVLHSSGKLHLGVTGWSMLPTILPGDTLVIEAADRKDVSIGDIVLFGRKRRLFVHRVIAQSGDLTDGRLLTQGDAMLYPDEAVHSSELLGRVSLISRWGECAEPRRKLSFVGEVVAVLVRRFYWAARMIAELHFMRQQERIGPCHN